MKKLKGLTVFLALILVIGSSTVSAQGKLGVVGKLFTKQEANVLFGKVIGSMNLSVTQLKNAISNTKDYVLISVKNNTVVLRDERRRSISEENEYLDDKDVLYIFSKSQIQNLLGSTLLKTTSSLSVSASTDPVVTVEIRASVLTLTAGDTTLEFALPCPPMCD